ncbi:MAG TPA: hypothetical protein VIS07_15310 [Candidatus Binatia bacterium]
MKVMRERRILAALAMASAFVLGTAGTSSAQILPLVEEDFSHIQPAAQLVMPFDATEGKESFLIVSNIGGTSPAGGPQITTHWTFWSSNCNELANFSICLTLNDTVVVDPTNARAIGPDNSEFGPVINLTGQRGLVTVTAYETNNVCGDFSSTGAQLIDNAIVGTFTFADTSVGYAFGNDAFGLGLDVTGTRVELPESGIVDSFNIQTFDPTSVEASVVVLSHLREQPVGQVEPSNAAIRFATTFYDINEIPTSLPDQTVGCVKFTTVSSEPGGPAGLIPANINVTTSGIIRLEPVAGFTPTSYLYGIIGQAVGPFGASSSTKVLYQEPSASRAFVDAPSTLLD